VGGSIDGGTVMNPFSLPFMQIALAASLMAGTALALIGVFILANRVSFSGLAVSQLAALGTVIGACFNFHFGNYGFAIACVGIGMILLSQISKTQRVPKEAWVASLYILGSALAVLILSKAPRGEADTLSVFFGNVLSLGMSEIWESLFILLLSCLILAVWFHRWIWISFDPLSVEVSKIKVGRWNFLFYSLFTLAMTVSIHIFGVLLAFTYLLLPAAIGMMLTKRLHQLFIFIPIFTGIVTFLGFYFSFRLDFPTGPFIASVLAGIVLACGIYRKWIRPS
jgi:ABC-type Mn2+/Zn2+ transport system permease subunit